MRPFRVCVSSITRFHAFSLAEQLQRQGCLERLLVSWFNPNSIAKGYDINPDRVTHNILFYGIDRLPHKLRPLRRFAADCQWLAAEWYDRWAARRLGNCEVFVGWSSYSLRTLRRAKRMGAVTVLERGSTHIAAQRDLLAGEAARWDLNIAIFLFAVLIIVVILLFQEIGIEIVAPVALFGLAMVWLVGWRRGQQLYQRFYEEELAKLEQELRRAVKGAVEKTIEETIEERVQKALRERWK